MLMILTTFAGTGRSVVNGGTIGAEPEEVLVVVGLTATYDGLVVVDVVFARDHGLCVRAHTATATATHRTQHHNHGQTFQ